MKRTMILLMTTLLCAANSFTQTHHKRPNSNNGTRTETDTVRRNYGDTYAIFNSGGEIVGLYNRSNCSSLGCTPTTSKTGTITRVESSRGGIYGFHIKYTNGKSKKWEGLSNDFGGLWSSDDQKAIASLIRVGKQVEITSCECGSGFIPALVSINVSQGHKATNVISSETWNEFWTAFRVAVDRRDRVALKKMLSNPFLCGGAVCTPSQWIADIDRFKLWRKIQKSAASGVMPVRSNEKNRRYTKDGYITFELGRDGRWRWVEVPEENG